MMKRYLFAFALLAFFPCIGFSQCSSPCVVTDKAAYSASTTTVSTAGVDTTGAKSMYVLGAYYTYYCPLGTATISDSYGNTWSVLRNQYDGNQYNNTLWYVNNPTTGAGHTITLSCGGAAIYPALVVAATSQNVTPDACGACVNGANFSGSTGQAGSISPSQNGEELIAGVEGSNIPSANPSSINNSFVTWVNLTTGTTTALAIAAKNQTTAAAINPTWTMTGSPNNGAMAVIASMEVASSISVTVAAVSPTQAVLSYTAPSSSACSVEVSQSNTYSPLVPDVDDDLFTGAKLDSRSGALTNGTSRVFVVGTRTIQTASSPAFPTTTATALVGSTELTVASGSGLMSGQIAMASGIPANTSIGPTYPASPNTWLLTARTTAPLADTPIEFYNAYSRALQQNTLHYYRVTCDGAVATGTFTTKTLPYGATYQDLIPSHSDGTYAYPSVPETRNTTVIDPQTGVFMSRVSLFSDKPTDYGFPFPSYGGFGQFCADDLDAYGNYRCALPSFAADLTYLYSINPTTGASTLLGFAQGSSVAMDPQADGSFSMGTEELMSWAAGSATTLYKGLLIFGRPTIARWVYSGDDSAGSGILTATTTDMLGGADLNTLARTFNSHFGDLDLTGTVTTTLSSGTYTVTWVSGSKFVEGASTGMIGRTILINGDYYTILAVPSKTSLTAKANYRIPPLAHASAVSFRMPIFQCSMVGAQANYGIVACNTFEQDSPAWIGAYNFGNGIPLGGGGSTAGLVALAQQYALPATRWMGDHTYEFLGETVPITSFSGSTAIQGGTFGTGPYNVVLGTNLSAVAPRTVNTISVSSASLAGTNNSPNCTDVWTAPTSWVDGEPLSPCYPHFLMNVAVGDLLSLSGGETIQIQTINSATSWDVIRGTQQNGGNTPTHSSGEVMRMYGAGSRALYNAVQQYDWNYGFWDFVNSPNGTEHPLDYVLNWGSHPVTRGTHRSEYYFDNNAAPTNKSEWGVPPPYTVPFDSVFAGVGALGGGNTYQKHPSIASGGDYSQFDNWYFVGANAFGAQTSSTATLLSPFTHVYKYDPTGGLSWMAGDTWSKNAPIFAKTNGRSLVDVSAPSKVLSDIDDFVWCRPNADGECYAGSRASEPYVYFSLSTLDTNYCTGGENPTTAHDICIGNWTALAVSMNQSKFVTPNDTTGALSLRPLVRTLQNYEGATSVGNNIKTTYLGDWGLYYTCVGPVRNAQCAYGSTVWALQIPPDPGSDGVNRDDFVPATLNLTAPSGLGIATARVKFWYVEQGGILSDPYCTSRREGCVAVSATVSDSTPFSYITTDMYMPATCSTTCTIALPVVPLHTAYFSVEYLNSGGSVISTQQGVATEKTVVFD